MACALMACASTWRSLGHQAGEVDLIDSAKALSCLKHRIDRPFEAQAQGTLSGDSADLQWILLAELDKYGRPDVAFSTFYDERVPAAVEKHKLAIRSAVLVELSQQDPLEIGTVAGKDALRQSPLVPQAPH